MSVFDAIKTEMNSVTAITDKIYHAEALKNASPPFAFWLQDSEETEQALDGYTELESAGFEVHLVARKLESLDPIARGVKAAVIALQGRTAAGYLFERINIRQTSPVINEKEVGLYRKVYYVAVDYQTSSSAIAGIAVAGRSIAGDGSGLATAT